VKQLVAVMVGVVMTGGPARGDMSSPVHTRVPTRTTVTLEKPIPGYVFYAASQFDDGYIVRLSFENGRTVAVPHLNDRMVLIAVPEAVVGKFPTAETLVKELREKRPAGVCWYSYDGFFSDFTLDTHRDDKLHIVIRQGKDGIEFEETKRPSTSGSYRVLLAGLGWTVLAILFGCRWARRRQKRA